MQSTILRHLADLVAFPTVSSDSNLDVIAHVEALVAPLGARLRRFPDPGGDKTNLLISIGPEVAGGLVFSGHTDVVPVAGQDWTGDPWTLRRIGDRVVGRGACDMKGFLACCLAVLPEIARLPLQTPVHLAFSYDEEVGCTGVIPMAEWVGPNLRPRLAVIGEPSMMQLITAHKGGSSGWCTLRGRSGHSSRPERGANAVMAAARLIDEFNIIRRELREGPLFEGLDPPWSTVQVNMIEGGSGTNVIAEHCRFSWEMRMIPGQSAAPLLDRLRAVAAPIAAEMQAVDPDCFIRFEPRASVSPLRPNGDAALEGRLLALLGQGAAQAVPYGTEAGVFQDHGTPAVVVGPGDIDDAHQPDEGIAVAQLDACADFLLRLAREG